MMSRSESSENAGIERRGNPESPVVRAAVVFRKFLRLGKHSDGNMVVSVHRRAGADHWNEQADDTAERVIGQECCLAKAECPTRTDYLRAKRPKSAIWPPISSRAESYAERMPGMRRLKPPALGPRARAPRCGAMCLGQISS